MSLLGIDIGSSSCKGVVFGTDGKELAKASRAYTSHIVRASMVEIEATIFRDAVFDVIRILSEQVTADPVEAIAISSHGETTIPVDRNGNAVAPAIMNSDNRATDQAEWWGNTFGKEKIYAITGVPLHPMFSLSKIMWIRKYKPQIYAKAERFLSVGDYILTQLGLPPYTDYSLASRTMAFDIKGHCWSQDILHHCDIPKEKLGIPVESGSVAGKLSKEIASVLGLKEGTVVALGGHDQPCGAFGAGAVHAGDVFDSAGTYECMVAVSDVPMNSAKAMGYSLNSYCHVVPGKFVTLAFFPAALVSGWFTDQFCYEDKIIAEQSGRQFFDVLNENTLKYCAGPSGLCITPHFVGSCTPHWDVKAKGTMAGFTPDITRYHIYKGIHEGIACELALNAEVLEEIVGPFSSMNISGGNARSEFAIQLRADITGKLIRTLIHDEAVCLGAALLAGIAIGKYKDASDAVSKVVKTGKTIVPDPGVRSAYEKQVERYHTLYPSLERFRKI